MMFARLSIRLNQWFSSHIRVGFWLIGLLLAASLVGMVFLRPVENIASMIPDDTSGLAEDFRFIQKAPFTRRVLIDVAAPPGSTSIELATVGDAFSEALPASLFPDVFRGPGISNPTRFVRGMLELMPALFTEKDQAAIETLLSPEVVRRSLRESVRTVTSPEGIGMAHILRQDPLGFRKLVLAKLGHLRLSGSFHIEHGRFMSEDGRHMLLIARPTPEMTDVKGASQVMAAFSQAQTVLPTGYVATLVGGYRHTQDNAAAIKSDMSRVLAASAFGLALIFLLFFRSRAGLFAFLLPLAVLPPAALATRLVFGSISGITLGFGAVLMAVVVDYSIHVYFAMRVSPHSPLKALGQVAAPIWCGAATSLLSFAALLFSVIPGVRELAFFSLTGLSLALMFALMVLPCLIRPESIPAGIASGQPFKPLLTPWQAFFLATLVLVFGAYWGRNVHFNSDLRSLSASSPDIRKDETMLGSIWGNMHDRTVVFAEGINLNETLEANWNFFAQASGDLDVSGLLSLAPILPPAKVQSENIDRWRDLFTPERIADLRTVIEAEAAEIGFTPGAFEPFWSYLRAPNPVNSTPERLRDLGLGEAVDLMLTQTANGFLAISLLSDDTEGAAVGGQRFDHVQPVSQAAFARELTTAIKGDFIRFVLLALVGNIILLYGFLRSVRLTLLSLLPTAVGLAILFGTMGVIGMELNVFGVIGVPLIIGIGVDYGIFMAMDDVGERDGTTMLAVIVAGLSTIVGFGALVLAQHPALYSIGLTVLIGISGAVLASCLFLPPLVRR